MHILVLPSWYLRPNRLERGSFFKEQAEAIAKAGVKVSLVYIEAVELTSFKQLLRVIYYWVFLYRVKSSVLEDHIVFFPVFSGQQEFRKKITDFFYKRIIKRIQYRQHIDIVHVHSYSCLDVANDVGDQLSVPVVYTEHSTGFYQNLVAEEQISEIRDSLKKVQKKIAVSPSLETILNKKIADDFIVVPNFIDVDFFLLNKKSLKNHFVCVGGLIDRKNCIELIKAFREFISNIDTEAQLVIVGDGVERAALERLIESYELNDNIKLVGRQNRAGVRGYIQKSSAMIFPSLYETFGVVAIEAMSCGKPVIATPSGGIDSILVNQSLGVLCDGFDSNAIFNGLKEFVKSEYDPDLIRSYVVDNFSADSVVKKYVELYESVIAEYSEIRKGHH